MVFIAGDTLRQQPIGAGHMTVLQLRGPMGSRVLPWWLFIAGDTLCHQPMRTGHMTVLQLRGLMKFRVLQWCHPMPASTRRTSCCTRIITFYGTRKWIQAHTSIRNNIISSWNMLRFEIILPCSNGDSLDPWRYINHVLSENRNSRFLISL